MSLYDLLNKPKAKETSHTVNLNRTQVSSSLQNNLSLSVVKPYSKRKSQQPPLLLKAKIEPTEPIVESRMVHRFDTRREESPMTSQNKRLREPSHEYNMQQQQPPRPIMGKSSELFKPFLRITDIQSAESIRSLETLQKAFKHLKVSARNSQLEYPELIEQFRSLRQDLHVQNIENNFTVEVLEFTLQFALRNNDLPNFSKCVGQLQQVCRMAGTTIKPTYLALHIIYLLMNKLTREYQSLVESLTVEQLGNATIRKAINLYRLLCVGNYYRIQRDFSEGLEGQLMQHFHIKIGEEVNKILGMAIVEKIPSVNRNLYSRLIQTSDRHAHSI